MQINRMAANIVGSTQRGFLLAKSFYVMGLRKPVSATKKNISITLSRNFELYSQNFELIRFETK